MHILALEPYLGGSHQAFLDGWREHSKHRFTIIDLPPRTWKWRMRHAAVTLARDVAQRLQGETWDVLFCSDMLNLAEFRGLCPLDIARLPRVVYFHENQLTYPVRSETERDLHFAYTNFTTCLSADAIWFNSAYHREDFLTALDSYLARMPDYQARDSLAEIADRSDVQSPAVRTFPMRKPRARGPLRILWAARWEHDKNPEDFFAALQLLMDEQVDFRVSVIGQQFRDTPAVFEQFREKLAERIDYWGYQPTYSAYCHVLQAADVFVSTADHEFFGLAAVEAMAAGCYPLLPRRLAYPELLANVPNAARYFYDGTVNDLARNLGELSQRIAIQNERNLASPEVAQAMQCFAWPSRAAEMDVAIQSIAAG